MSGHEGAVRAVAASLDGVSRSRPRTTARCAVGRARGARDVRHDGARGPGPPRVSAWAAGREGPREGPGGAPLALAMSGGKDCHRVWDVSEDGGAQVSSFDAHANVIRGSRRACRAQRAASCADRPRAWGLSERRGAAAREAGLSRESVSSGTSSSSSACLATFVGHSGGLTSVALASNRALAFTGSLITPRARGRAVRGPARGARAGALSSRRPRRGGGVLDAAELVRGVRGGRPPRLRRQDVEGGGALQGARGRHVRRVPRHGEGLRGGR